jgi:hypothetical protein
MLGLVLALAVIAIVFMLLGLWIFSLPIGIAALILFIVFLVGLGRRPARQP